MKKIWRKNFEIKRISFLLANEASENFFKFQKPTIGKDALTELIWINKGVDNLGTYFVKDELREMINLTLEAIINRPAKVKAVHKKTIAYNRRYFVFSKKLRKVDFGRLSNKQIANVYRQHYQIMQPSHGYSLCSTWFVDSDGEDLTNYLLNYVKNQIEKNKLKLNFAEVFSLLTTPSKHSLVQIENIESLEILKLIKANQVASKIFLSKDVREVENNLSKIKPALRKKINRHYYKWCWTPYTYLGPAYELNYYLEIWSGLLRQKINTEKELSALLSANKRNTSAKKILFKKLKIDKQNRQIFDLASEIVWLKAYRKDALFLGCFVIDKVYKEIGRRLGLSLNQARHLTYLEVNDAILKNKFSVKELNERMKSFVIYFKNGKFWVLTGSKAKAFLAKQNFEKVTIADVRELKGTPASPGRVKGVVKVIDVPEEMIKMKAGDIMVSHATFPALVPAMKKAAAIVTDDGGLTCHAAIVARELKTPCVVGVKIATKVLKDGDRVEVDANNGIIRKL